MAAKSQKTEANATSRHFETADAEPTGAACLPAAEPIDAALTQLDYYYGRDAGSGNKDKAPDCARPREGARHTLDAGAGRRGWLSRASARAEATNEGTRIAASPIVSQRARW